MNAIPQLITRIRRRKGLSQREMAFELGLATGQSISNIERGVAPLPHLLAKTIRRRFKVPKRDFMNAYVADYMIRIEGDL